MKNLKKKLENQQKVNEAVENIYEYFRENKTVLDLFRTMAQAQTCIMQLMEINRYHETLNMPSVPTDEITEFIFDVSEIYKHIEPFYEVLESERAEEN